MLKKRYYYYTYTHKSTQETVVYTSVTRGSYLPISGETGKIAEHVVRGSSIRLLKHFAVYDVHAYTFYYQTYLRPIRNNITHWSRPLYYLSRSSDEDDDDGLTRFPAHCRKQTYSRRVLSRLSEITYLANAAA